VGLGCPLLVALDSNVFIAFIEQDEFFETAAEIIQKIEHGMLDAVYSSIVYGEVMRMPAGSSLEPIRQFFDTLGGKDYPANRIVCSKAAELRRTYPPLKLPDALHLATAIIARADTFITADKRLLAVAKKEITSVYLKDFTVL
jgi:predicted nucleic acid-binding protein